MYHRKLHGEVHYLDFDSQVLRNNPLEDPHKRTFPIYLPPGYDETDRSYPVIFALAGFTGTGLNLSNFSVWEESLPEQMDDLIVNRDCPPAILVMPDCFTSLGGSQYINSTATGAYEDYLIEELVPVIDLTYRTLTDRDHRGIIGKSSGGYGALTLAMKHGDVFGGVACLSGDMYFEYCYLRDFPHTVNTLNTEGGVEAFLKSFNAAERKSSDQIQALNIVAMAAAYSPRGTEGLLPFDLPTGKIIQKVWDQWLEKDPVRMIDRYAMDLKRLKLLFLEAGAKDEFYLHLGARVFVEQLRTLNIEHIYEEHAHGHFGINFRYKVGLEKLARVLSRKA